MKITIQERLAPYSHALHSRCLLPGTHLIVDAAFPRLRVGGFEIALPPTDGSCDATLQQDLEKGCVWVFSKHFRMKIFARSGAIQTTLYQKGQPTHEMVFPLEEPVCLPVGWERLSLGVQKAQDWDLVLRRFDLKEILPVLYGLVQKIPSQAVASFDRCDLESLKMDLRSELEHILVPKNSSVSFLRKTFETIRSWFFMENEKHLSFLSFCPFLSGRMTNIQSQVGSIDLEWRKQTPRRMVIRSLFKGSIHFVFPKNIISFRWKNHPNEKGSRHLVGDPFLLEPCKTYFFDCFYLEIGSSIPYVCK